MREIKFRAWDLDNFNMWHSDKEEKSGEGLIIWEIDNNGSPQFLEPQLINTCPGGEYHEQTIEYRAPNQEIMQCTGLKDKNGKEIYEGDIIGWWEKGGWNFKGEVLIEPGCYIIKDELGTKRFFFKLLEKYNVKVVGNKYENPELIENA